MKTQVLVIGGGFAGVAAARELEAQGISTTLVDRKDYFEVTYAVLRDATDPKQNDGKARRYYREILPGTFVQSGVAELQLGRALLDSGDTLEFDKVIIASGSRYPSLPLAKSVSAVSREQRDQELGGYHHRLKSASSVLIIGGGVVGVELAGEVAFAMPEAKVTLAHKGEALLAGYKPRAQHKALRQLRALGVNVEFNTHYQQQDGVYRDGNSGRSLTPDLVLTATGTLPNNEFMKAHFSHTLDERGLIQVDDRLAVEGQEDFYAIGDVANVGEAKLGYLALEQGKYLGRALARQMKGKSITPYKRHPFMALVPTGQKTGVVQLPFAVTSWRTLVNIKQKDLFISKTFKALVG